MKNKPWKKWKTRKFTFIFALVFFLVYTGISLVMTGLGLTVDATLTDGVFSFLKWITTTGCAIVIADKMVKTESEDE